LTKLLKVIIFPGNSNSESYYPVYAEKQKIKVGIGQKRSVTMLNFAFGESQYFVQDEVKK